MTFLHAIILGIVEGITEFLPISSTGHLIIAERLLGIPSSEFMKSFDIVIQLGAILAVLTAFGRRLLGNIELCKRVLIAFVPTAVLGVLFYKTVKSLLGSPDVVLWAMGIGGILLIAFEYRIKEPADAGEELSIVPYRTALLLGVAQSVAMIPGVSRSAATIVGGLWLGMSRRAIVEFSFLLALPTMAAASGLDLLKHAGSFDGSQWQLLLVGFLVSWGVAWVAISWLLRYIRSHDFTVFGVYRVIAAIAFWLILR